LPLCPHAKRVKGTIVYCELAGRKVSSLKYPCKGRYQACPIYRARAGRRPARREEVEERPQPVGRVESVEEVARAAPEPEPVEAEAVAAPREEEAPPAAPPAAPVAGEAAVRESPPNSEAVTAFPVKPGRSVCDPLFQANVILKAEESRDFRGTFQEIAALSRGREGTLIYFAGTITDVGAQVRLVAFNGVIVSVQVEPGRGETAKCGEEALEYVKPDAVVSGVLYFVSLQALEAYAERIREEASL